MAISQKEKLEHAEVKDLPAEMEQGGTWGRCSCVTRAKPWLQQHCHKHTTKFSVRKVNGKRDTGKTYIQNHLVCTLYRVYERIPPTPKPWE